MISAPRLSIVIPAHDEGPLIASTLARALNGAIPGEFEVVVVANGCRDDTAAQARTIEGVSVCEISAASKIAALNAGDQVATVFPRIYLDADVEVDTVTLRELAEVLAATDEPRIASPRLRVDASGSSWAVRQHVRIWEQSDYRQRGHIGSGIYAVNATGRARWGRFPDVIADDRFAQQRFTTEERITLPEGCFTVRAPRDMPAHIRRATRIEVGNRRLRTDQQVAAVESAPRRFARLLGRVAARPRLWPALPVYVYGYGVPMVRARGVRRTGSSVAWSRDTSLRTAAAAESLESSVVRP